MIAPVVLILLGLILALLGPIVLRRSSWLKRSPRIGIAAWQALSFSLVSTVILAGAALAVPVVPWTTDLAELVRACTMALVEQYSTPGGAIVSTTGIVAVLAMLARVGYSAAKGLIAAASQRSRQLQSLALIAHPHRDVDALVVEHQAAAAYCLPGRGGRIVLTSAALAALDRGQLDAVLAHERAHLRGRHDLILAAADALLHAFPAYRPSARPGAPSRGWWRCWPTTTPPGAPTA